MERYRKYLIRFSILSQPRLSSAFNIGGRKSQLLTMTALIGSLENGQKLSGNSVESKEEITVIYGKDSYHKLNFDIWL